jgi:hypothetical protein
MVIVVLSLAAAARPLPADPTPSLDQLLFIPQGGQVTLLWHFYYKLLPPKFIFREKNSLAISLDDPATLKQNLTLVASNAFDLNLDDRPAPLTKIIELTLAPDGGCLAKLLYPGRRNGRLRLREPLLAYYPSSYVMDYRIFNPLRRGHLPAGYFMGGESSSSVIEFVESDQNAPPSVFDFLYTTPVMLFKEDLRSAWINTNWLFIALLLVLTRPPRELYPFALIMAALWIVPCFFWTMDNLQVGLSIHPIFPALVTVAMCVLCRRRTLKFGALCAALAVAGLLNGCFDIQQTNLERPDADVLNLIGESLGFAAGLGLVFVIGYLLVAECRKFPGFNRDWKPKICWIFAILALALSFVR